MAPLVCCNNPRVQPLKQSPKTFNPTLRHGAWIGVASGFLCAVPRTPPSRAPDGTLEGDLLGWQRVSASGPLDIAKPSMGSKGFAVGKWVKGIADTVKIALAVGIRVNSAKPPACWLSLHVLGLRQSVGFVFCHGAPCPFTQPFPFISMQGPF